VNFFRICVWLVELAEGEGNTSPPAENLLEAAKRLGWHRRPSKQDMGGKGMGAIEEDNEMLDVLDAEDADLNTNDLGRPANGDDKVFAEDPHWKNKVLFYEYFHADTGKGLGASHQVSYCHVCIYIHTYIQKRIMNKSICSSTGYIARHG
jgi:hypothetical protein